MDPVLVIGIALVGAYILFRLRYVKRRSGMNDAKGKEIKKKLQELRKKRNEE